MNRKKLVIILPIIMVFLLSCELLGGKATEEPTQVVIEVPTLAPATLPPPPTQKPTEEPTEEPTLALPTLEPTPEGFDATTASWEPFVVAGDKTKDFWKQSGDKILFEMPSPETYAYAFAEDVNLGDVEVKVVAKTKDSFQNGVAVVCRQSDEGWYELRVHTVGMYAGSYSLYRYSAQMADERKNPYVNVMKDLDRVFTNDLNGGSNNTNTIVFACLGNQLQVFINGKQQFRPPTKDVIFTDDVLTQGSVGFGAMSFGKGKVNVEIDLTQMSATE